MKNTELNECFVYGCPEPKLKDNQYCKKHSEILWSEPN